MRVVRDGDSCERFESTCERLNERTARGAGESGPSETGMLEDEHVARCPECSGAVRAAERLLRARGAYEVPEPGPGYWESFSQRLDERLADTGRAASRPRSWWPRLGAALAASVVLVAGALAVRQLRTAAVSAPTEDELLGRLGEAPEERVVEWLDEIAPAEIGTAPEDLADAENLLGDDAPATGDDSPYDLFLDLGEEDRARLLKEMRGEIG